MFGRKVGGSSERMHTMAVAAVKCATDCIANNSVRHCAYFSHCQDLPVSGTLSLFILTKPTFYFNKNIQFLLAVLRESKCFIRWREREKLRVSA